MPSRSPFPAARVALAAALLPLAAGAQPRLSDVVVTGNALRAADPAAPVSVLGGDALWRDRATTLGDTLRHLPGVSQTWFGPNASRPVLRGQDGDRIRMLGNGGASFDAASLSFDHAVPIDPLVAERVEVLRGPAALLYGGNAIGGVVNTIDNRIPSAPITRPGGAAELRVGGAAAERGGAALVETGNGRFALHADLFGRETEDLRVPRFRPPEDGAPAAPTRRVRNSASRTEGGALGASLTSDAGHLGVAVDGYRSRYGVVVEPEVTIRMRRDQVALAGERRLGGGAWRTLRGRLAGSDYEHIEFEGAEVGTTFTNRGRELRLEAEHAPIGPWRGVVGLQWERSDFAALGEEAFVPGTRSTQAALFVVEEAPLAGGTLGAGLRIERSRVASEGDAGGGEPRFGAAQERRFAPRSASLSWQTPAGAGWSAGAALSASERAPSGFELYADGVHVATGQYERGDPALGVERGRNLDLWARWQDARSRLRVGLHAARFSRYIVLDATGETFDEEGESFPVYAFRGTRAGLAGLEVEARRRLLDGAWVVDLDGVLDLTRGTDRSRGTPLPRLAPWRLRVAVEARRGALGLQAAVEHRGRQTRVAPLDEPTDALTRFDLGVDGAAGAGRWFVQVENLFDELGFNAASSPAVRALAPFPGRSVKAGLRASF